MIWQWLQFFRGLFLISSAFASVELICDDRELKGLCHSDNEQRMCTCEVTAGDTLRWSATQPGVCACCTGPADGSIIFSSANPVGNSTAHPCIMGITAELTNNTEGQLNSTLNFKPSAVSTKGLIVTCSSAGDIDERRKTLNVTYSDPPKTRQFTSFNITCDTSNGTYRASITFNDDETGGSDIQYYNGTVAGPSGFSSQFNATNNTVVIPGLQCSTSYNINVTAVNCAGVSTVTATWFTTPQPDLSTFTIKSACFDSSSTVRVEWMPPITTPCYSINGYFLSVVNNISQQVSFGMVGEGTLLSISISDVSTYYNITVYAITDYRTITTTSNGSFTFWSDNKCVPTQSISLITPSTASYVTSNQTNVTSTPSLVTLPTTSNITPNLTNVAATLPTNFTGTMEHLIKQLQECLGIVRFLLIANVFTLLALLIIMITSIYLCICINKLRKSLAKVAPSKEVQDSVKQGSETETETMHRTL